MLGFVPEIGAEGELRSRSLLASFVTSELSTSSACVGVFSGNSFGSCLVGVIANIVIVGNVGDLTMDSPVSGDDPASSTADDLKKCLHNLQLHLV